MADALRESAAARAEPAAAASPAARPVQRRRTYRVHFGLANILLAVIVGAAVGSFIVLLGRPSHDEKAWSAWQPTGTPTERADQIVQHVGGAYRLLNGHPLVGIKYGPPFVQVGSNQQSVVGFDVATRAKTRFIPNEAIYDANGTIEYVLCGLSAAHKCAVEGGPATTERGRVLGREALELALFSFKYIPGTAAVFMLMPPNGQTSKSPALFFRRSELRNELSHPIRRTLPATETPSALVGLSPQENRVIDRLVSPHLFNVASYQQASNNGVIAVLTP